VTPTSSRGAESVTVTQRAPGVDESRQTAVVEMSDAELCRKTKSIVDEYLHLNDLKVHIISTLSIIYLVSAGLLSLVLCVVCLSVCVWSTVCLCVSIVRLTVLQSRPSGRSLTTFQLQILWALVLRSSDLGHWSQCVGHSCKSTAIVFPRGNQLGICKSC